VYRLSWKDFLNYCIVMIIIYLLLINMFNGQKVVEFDAKMETSGSIIYHNFMLFVKWQIVFVLSPIYWLFETLVLSWMIKSGVVTFGLAQAFEKLWRHGLIEIPNMFLYQLLSFRLLYFWWKNKSFTTIKEYVRENKNVYLLSGILILIAGMIEGIQW
jgi:uncharacterized membrane protein SpoIIM required for sporulation